MAIFLPSPNIEDENDNENEDGTKTITITKSPCLWRITTDGAARAEGKRGYTMPKYRANESRVKLAWLCRVQPIFNEVNRDGGRQSQIRNYLTRGAGDPREQELGKYCGQTFNMYSKIL